MPEPPVIGAQLTVLDLDRHRDWLFEKDRDLELPEFSMADILKAPDALVSAARDKLDGWNGRLGIHGPFAGFELDVRDREIRDVVQARLDQALGVCERLGARQMVIHSPYDQWDRANLDLRPKDRGRRVDAILDTLAPALHRAEEIGVEMVLENIQDVDPSDRMAVVTAADSPALSLSVDVGHAFWAHRTCGAPPPDRFIAAAGARLGHVHFQDGDGWADRHWVPGEGELGFPAVFAALADVKTEPHLIVELREFHRVAEGVAHLERLGLGQ